MKADIDRGEAVSMMEPLLISSTPKHYGPLADLAVELSEKSMGLKRSLPPPIVSALSDLVRAMNCYYSNLIEGHDTHPVDIERALNEDYSADPEKRDLQLEARAHIPVQQWIDEGGLKDRALTAPGPPTKNRKTLNWTTFTPPATALCRRYSGLLLLRRSQQHGPYHFPDIGSGCY